MQTLGLVLMILGSIALVGSFAYLFIRLKNIIKAVALEAFDMKKELIILLALSLGFGLSVMVTFIGIPLWLNWTLNGGDWACTILGSFLLGSVIGVFYTTFRLHYYQTKIDKKLDKKLYLTMLVMIPMLVLTTILTTEGFAMHVAYPLINGISWQNGFHWTHAGQGGTNIAFYALCIVSGAVYVYFICDHFLYQKYGKHGLVESTFLLAFPAGIIGARIAYVIGNWNVEFGPVFATDPWKMFRMWEGGLTILGGAIAGIVVGVLWFKHVNKGISIGDSVNIIVPTILIAQAVGRWGNFFNAEVHGIEVSGEAWQWLPTFIYQQMRYSSVNGFAAEGNIYVPLFLIEGIINLAGYFFLFLICGKLLKKYVKGWDLAFGYVAWYGATRMIMEPLRDPKFNMGDKARWSWIWAIIFICVGLLCIIINHIVRYILKEKKNPTVINEQTQALYKKNSIIGIGATIGVSLTIFITGICLYTLNTIPEGASLISLCPHNIGFMLWTVGLSLIPSVAIPILYFIKSRQPIIESEQQHE